MTFRRWGRRLAHALFWLEPAFLVAATYAFWFPTPARLDWLWLLWGVIPLAWARWVCHGRMLTRTPLDAVFAVFMGLGVVNAWVAPYSQGLLLLARPLLGMVTCYAMVEQARLRGLRGPVQVMVILALLVGVQALGATQWNRKSVPLSAITDALPTLKGAATMGGFNANEIAGGMVWLLPLLLAVALYRWRTRGIRWDVTLAAGMLALALFLGQSRSAMAGTLAALGLLSITLLRGWGRWLLWAFIVGLVALEIGLFAGDFSEPVAYHVPEETAELLLGDDADDDPITSAEGTVAVRLEVWGSALNIIRDYPLTGVGIGMYRDLRVRALYPVPSVRILPHAHNEYLQIGADMGLPGLAVFVALYGVAARMLWLAWRRGDAETRAVTAGVAAGLLAHAIFGLSDAITLWDRFAFVFWLMLGMAGAVFIHAQSAGKTAAESNQLS